MADIVTGTTPSSKQPEAWGNELDFITPSDQSEFYREASPSRFLSSYGAELFKKRIVPAGSTNLTCIGSTIGKVSMAMRPSVTNQQINSIVAKKDVADPIFIYYMIRNWSGILKVEAAGSATPIINKTTLSNYSFVVPPLAEQRAIAEVLGALDDKIAANNRLVAQSDELSQAIFRSSLIGDNQMLPLSSIADFVNGKAFTKNASGTGRVVIRIAEMNSGIGNSTVFNDIEVDEKHIARPGDILFAWSGSLTLQRWFRPEGIVNQHIFKVIARDGNPNWLVYELLRDKLDYYKRVAANKATTMGHIQRKDLDELVHVPDGSSLTRIAAQMTALWNKMLNTEQESLQLAATRDALLPQLMSGKMRVRDAEAVVEDVL